MTHALAWLEPLSVLPAARDEGQHFGERFDGLVGRTPEGGFVPLDVLAGAEGRAASLRAVVPPGAALARTTAVWVHTGRLCPARTDVVVDAERRVHAPVVVHRQRLAAPDVVRLGGVATTTPLRTAVDLLCFTGGRAAVAGTCELLLGGLDPPEVAEALRRPGRRAPVRRALELLAVAENAARRRRP